MKLKLAEGAYNRMGSAMGQLFAPRAFGSKKCVVLAFVVRPFIQPCFSFTSAEASRNLGFLRVKVGMLKVGLQLAGYSSPNRLNEDKSLLKKK